MAIVACSAQTKECNTPTTCSFNRTGPFCGQCEKDHFVNLNNKCVHNSKCSTRSQHIFWSSFLSIPVAIALLLTFANDMKLLAVRLALKMACCCSRLNRSQDHAVRPREINIGRSSINQKEISLSAIFNNVMTFFQLKALITVKGATSDDNHAFLDQIFNIEWVAEGRKEFENLCPFYDMTVIHRMFMMGYLNPITMVLTLLFCLLTCKLLNIIRSVLRSENFNAGRFYVGYYIVLAFSYKNICQTAFSFTNCKTMNGKLFLYIDGSIECFQPWQIANLIFLVSWVFPFPLAVAIGYHKLKNREISRFRLIMFLTFPSVALVMMSCKKFIKTESRHLHEKADERLVEMFELPYKEQYIWWEAWRLMERFIIAGLSVFLTNPIYRILYITSLFALFCQLHRRVNPYKRSMFILKRLDAFSWVCLFLLSLLNEMRAIVYIYDIQKVDSIYYALRASNILEQIFSPIWYFIVALFMTLF